MRKTEMKTKINNEKGITLIALVITIIVLLILAGVAISMLSGENGILTQAAEAKTEYEAAQKQEEAQISDLEVISDFQINNTPYKFSNGYLTGVVRSIVEGESVLRSENVSDLEDKLPNEYTLCNIDGSDIENKDILVTTGMTIKKQNKPIGRVIILGDINDTDGQIAPKDRIWLNGMLNNFESTKNNLKEYNIVAADINQDGIINWIDLGLINEYLVTKNMSAINQNLIAKKFEKVVVENTSRKEYVNELKDFKDKFEWQEGSTARDGYYNYLADSTEKKAEDILNKLSNKKTVIVSGVNKLNPTDDINEGDVITLIEKVNGVEVSLDIAKITIQ